MDRQNIDDMARLYGLVQTAELPSHSDGITDAVADVGMDPAFRPPSGDPGVGAMRSILEAFYGLAPSQATPGPKMPAGALATPAGALATPSMEAMANLVGQLETGTDTTLHRLLEESGPDQEIRTAMQTRPTASGVRIGEWDVHMRTEGKRQYYSVQRADEYPIATDLLLYEAAIELARLLTLGTPINAKPITTIILAEQGYASALADAIHFTHLLRKSADNPRREIFEDRLAHAKRKAVNARRSIQALRERR